MGDATDNSDGHPGRLRRLLVWLPHWAVALLLLLPILIVDTFDLLQGVRWLPWAVGVYTLEILTYVAFVIPGAMKRLSWRHILVMLGIGAVLYAQAHILPWWEHPIAFPYDWSLVLAFNVTAVGAGEWALTARRSWRSLAWLVLLSLAVAFVVCPVNASLVYCGWRFTVPTVANLTGKSIHSSRLLHRPLLAVLMWAAIPLALRAGKRRTRASGLAIGAVVLASLGVFVVFFEWGVYEIAERSISGQGLFGRAEAAFVLRRRGSDSDVRLLRAELEKADWSVPQSTAPHAWRDACIRALGRHDPKGTADYLSELLRTRPTEHLAGLSARLLVREHRYETVPLLMRYGLLADYLPAAMCTTALAEMELPQASLLILRRVAGRHIPGPLADDFAIDQYERERLAALLGADAGSRLSDWLRQYGKVIDQLPTPLSEPYRKETQLTIECATDYRRAQSLLYRARLALMAQRMRADDKAETVPPHVFESAKAAVNRPDLERLIVMGDDMGLVPWWGEAKAYYERAARELPVQEPNLDVPTTDDLRGQIDQYVDRVNRKLRQYHLATSQPGTIPHGGAPKRN